MKQNELIALLRAIPLVENEDGTNVTDFFASDLLSHTLANCPPGAAWITVQLHLNVIAVAVRAQIPVVILADSLKMEEEVLACARREGIAVLSTDKSVFEICGILYAFQNGFLCAKDLV